MKLIPLFLLFTFITGTLSTRDYTNRLYYTLRTTDKDSKDAVENVAITLNARLEGQVGELNQYYLISIPKQSKRTDDSLITRFNNYKTRLSKRDLDWQRVDQIQAQVPTRRIYKRAPPIYSEPIVENKEEEYKLNGESQPIELPGVLEEGAYDKIKGLLDIQDPGFNEQWHLVKYFYLFVCLCILLKKSILLFF